MTQPKFAPIQAEDQVREAYHLQTPRPWVPGRPADFRPGSPPRLRGVGTAGPDQGYALLLARRFVGKFRTAEGESPDDAVASILLVALRRAAVFGRAPVLHDLGLGFTLAGYLGDPPQDLVEWRCERFRGASHDDWAVRELGLGVPESTLRMMPGQVADSIGRWRELWGLPAAG